MADILGIQIVGLLFSVFMMYYTFLQYKKKQFNVREYTFWLVFWAIFIVLTLAPSLLDPILGSLSIGRALDFFIIMGFLFLILISFYTYTLVKRNEKKIEDMVRKQALKK